ncbi:MAG: IS30 family transposase [bacterium]
MSYHQITREERYTISALRRQGYPTSRIAAVLGRHRSSIYRETRRNQCTDGGYRPFKADSRTRGRRSRSRRNRQFEAQDLAMVESLLRLDWSPEQVSGYLKRENLLNISHETIYLYVWADKGAGGDLYTHLRGASKQRRKRYGAYDSRGRLAGKRHISERPASIETRDSFGHWEVDTVLGNGDRNCVVTLVERKTRYSLIGKLKARTAEQLNARLLKIIRRHPTRIKTITADNGTEFHGYKSIERKTGVKFYFATPHHSWERGTNENTNGLIRQYLPKAKSMASVNQHQCNAIAAKLNSRPRKTLGFFTPEECIHA